MKDNFGILVNTTDKFEDCWFPFFTLFKKFWPEYTGKIYLNTETKSYTHEGLNIICVQNNIDNPTKRITWSECLVRALKKIDEDIILYMQEDYFLKDFVKNRIVEYYIELIQNNCKISCIHLTDQGSTPGELSEFDNLFTVPKYHSDRISCQAALWRKDVLLNYPRLYENAWNFEKWGSKRAAILNHNFYVVDKNWVRLNTFEIIPYIFTAVISGKWVKDVVPLCEMHNIKVDFSKRGFHYWKTRSLKNRILDKINRFPTEIKSFIGLVVLKFKS